MRITTSGLLGELQHTITYIYLSQELVILYWQTQFVLTRPKDLAVPSRKPVDESNLLSVLCVQAFIDFSLIITRKLTILYNLKKTKYCKVKFLIPKMMKIWKFQLENVFEEFISIIIFNFFGKVFLKISNDSTNFENVS